jgi:Zn-dependent protease
LAFGDPTARNMGRCSLNPLVHLDPIGTIVLLLTQFVGWARPVPVNPVNLRPRKWGDIAVSLAGPMSNLLLAVVAAGALRVLLEATGAALHDVHEAKGAAGLAGRVLLVMVLANIGLAVFNMLPLFPLDGHHIARELLPVHRQNAFMQWQIRYGAIVLMGLVFGPRLLGLATNGRIDINPIRWVYWHAVGLLGPILF